MKYKIEKKIDENITKYQCIIIPISKHNIEKNTFNNFNFINEEINKYKSLIIKKNTLIIKCNKNNQKFDLILLNYKKYNELKYKKTYENIILNSYKIIKNNKYKSVIYFLEHINEIKNKKKILNIIKIIEKNQYKYTKFKTKKYKNKIKKISFFIKNINIEKIEKQIHIYTTIIKGINISKNLCNTPPNICNSTYIYSKVIQKIKGNKIKISYLNEKNMKKLGMNAYLSVNNGSSNKPLMITIKYQGSKNKKKKPIILIGKGITFDSGGISLKPSINMHEMKYDMTGASNVLGIMYIINKIKLKTNVIGILACAENMVDKNSTRPGDIIKTLSGKTVEIINTDAEGRLVLCDVLHYINKYNPSIVIDIATLTGACVVALGKKITGLFSNDKKLSEKIIKIGKKTKDYIWELPLFKKYNRDLKSNIADIKNCSEKYEAGAITAACFLSNFIKNFKWLHLDIAGTSNDHKGPTGRSINLLINFIIKIIKKNKEYDKK